MEREVKAMVTSGVGQISLKKFPYPHVKRDGLLVKMTLAGVCGTDPHIYRGRLPIDYPIIQGHENLAVVEEIGVNARERMKIIGGTLEEGDRVTWFPGIKCGVCFYCVFLPSNNHFICENPTAAYGLGRPSCQESPHLFGGFAEYVYILPNTWIYKIPDDLSDEAAVLIDVFNVPRLERAQAPFPAGNEGFNTMDSVVILGSGPVGVATAIRAKILGAERVIMTGAPRRRLNIAREFGVDSIVNMEEVGDPKERVKEVLNLTNGRGADLVVEAAGSPIAFREGLEMTRPGGVFYELGCAADVGAVEVNPYRHFCSKDIYVYGQYGTPPQEYQMALKILSKYKQIYPFEKLVTHRFRLEGVIQALEAVEREECMKAVIDFP